MLKLGKFRADFINETLRRFPLSILSALVFTCAMLVSNYNLFGFQGDEALGKITTLAAAGYFWFGAAKLAAESRGLKPVQHYGPGFAVFAGIAALTFFSPQWGQHYLTIIPALLALIVVGSFARSQDDFSFWFFNFRTWFGVVCATAAGIILAGGVSLSLSSIASLFDVEISHKIYGDVWIVICGFFGPLCALAWVPRVFNYAEQDCKTPPGLSFIVNWVLAPLVWLYMVILYAYLAKILITFELPTGQLAYMMTGFAGVGIVTYLVAWPIRDKASLQLRIFYRWFFPALIAPVFMMALAIALRISQYGVTEERYMVALAALWFGLIAAMFTMRKMNLRVIPITLATFLIFASFGPWGAADVSGYSQYHRLESLLIKNDILKDGRVMKTDKTVSFEDRKSISSIIDYFWNTNRKEWLAPWMEITKPGDPINGFIYPEDAVRAMGFEYISIFQQTDSGADFNFNAVQANAIVAVQGYDYAYLNQYAYIPPGGAGGGVVPRDETAGYPEITVSAKPDVFEVLIAGKGAVNIDVGSYIAANHEAFAKTAPKLMMLEGENDAFRVTVYLNSVMGLMHSEDVKISSLNYSLLIDLK